MALHTLQTSVTAREQELGMIKIGRLPNGLVMAALAVGAVAAGNVVGRLLVIGLVTGVAL